MQRGLCFVKSAKGGGNSVSFVLLCFYYINAVVCLVQRCRICLCRCFSVGTPNIRRFRYACVSKKISRQRVGMCVCYACPSLCVCVCSPFIPCILRSLILQSEPAFGLTSRHKYGNKFWPFSVFGPRTRQETLRTKLIARFPRGSSPQALFFLAFSGGAAPFSRTLRPPIL